MADDRTYYDAFMIRETDKARLYLMEDTKEEIWIPKSVIENQVLSAPPPGIGTLPGTPAIIRVADWFVNKNPKAFGE